MSCSGVCVLTINVRVSRKRTFQEREHHHYHVLLEVQQLLQQLNLTGVLRNTNRNVKPFSLYIRSDKLSYHPLLLRPRHSLGGGLNTLHLERAQGCCLRTGPPCWDSVRNQRAL